MGPAVYYITTTGVRTLNWIKSEYPNGITIYEATMQEELLCPAGWNLSENYFKLPIVHNAFKDIVVCNASCVDSAVQVSMDVLNASDTARVQWVNHYNQDLTKQINYTLSIIQYA